MTHINDLRTGDLVTWEHRDREHVARIDDLSPSGLWFSNSNVMFLYLTHYDDDTTFQVWDNSA